MAEQKKKRRVVKKSETVREQADKAKNTEVKPRRVKRVASKASSPFRIIGRLIAKILRPLRFLLWPFKTRIARFIGRILGKILLVNYFKESWQELRLVTWPNRKETFKLTLAVFVFAVSFALIIAVVDFGLDKVFKKLILG